MQQRTSNIIMIIKGQHNYGNIEPKDAIKKYMAETCGCEEADYTDYNLMQILSVVVQDYIKGCENPQRFLFDYFDALMNYYKGDSIKAWISALQLAQVCELVDTTTSYYKKYVNGFNSDNVVVIDENTGKEMFPNIYCNNDEEDE